MAAFLAMFMVLPLALANGSTTGTTNTSNPDPPLNPTAYAAFAGHYQYVAGGAAMRNQGYGNITLTWKGTLVKAYLVWAIINVENSGINTGKINGHSITGTLQSDDLSPCWGNGNIWVFATDVTSFVVNGTNHLTGFASGVTDGSDPWGGERAPPMTEGATLVVVSSGSAAQQVYIYTGTYTDPYAGNPLTSVFDHGAADSTTAQITFVIADGQESGNYAVWNGVEIDSNAFPGSDPHASPGTWSSGSLWDTRTYSVPVALGATSESAQIGAYGDCITWAAQVISIPTKAPLPPPPGSTPLTMRMDERLAWAKVNNNLCLAQRIENWFSHAGP